MFLRHLLGLVVLCNAASGGEVSGGGGAPAPAPAPPAAQPAAQPPAPPPVDREKIAAEARAAALKDLGFDSEDAYKAHLAEKKKADEARMTEAEKRDKALREALDERGRVESDLKAAKAELAAERAKAAMRAKLDAESVKLGEGDRIAVEALYDHAKAKAGKDFDEQKFFTELRKERPYLFGGSPQPTAPANTTTGGAPPPAPQQPSMFPGSFDASKLDEQQWRQWKINNGLIS